MFDIILFLGVIIGIAFILVELVSFLFSTVITILDVIIVITVGGFFLWVLYFAIITLISLF